MGATPPPARLLLEDLLELRVAEGEHPAVRVMDQHDLLGAEEVLREIASERISSSVITPPALRITCASLNRKAQGLIRDSTRVHAGNDRDLLGGRQRQVALVESSAKALLFSRNSSMALNLGLLSMVASFRQASKADRLMGFTRTSATDGENESRLTSTSFRW